jgi:DNA-binding transcriptional LysR family regulator
VLASFQIADPCRVELWIGRNPDVGERLASGRADLALMEWWDGRAGFAATTWRREPIVVIVSPGHPWATRREIAARELAGAPILGGEAGTGTGTLLRQALGPLADQLTTIGGSGSTEAVKRAVRAGRGISLVIASAVADEVETGHLVALRVTDADLAKEMKLILPEGTPRGAPAARFAAYASNVAA